MTQGPALPAPTWMVGCGNMGGALVAGWRVAGSDLTDMVVIRPSGTPVEGVRTVRTFAEAGPAPKLLILAFKPQQLPAIAPQLASSLAAGASVVSILAGVEAATLRALFPSAGAIVRAMPNLPVAMRRGVVALFSKDADGALQQQIGELFAALGWAAWLPDEIKFAAIGSVAGAGPAYVARFIDALRKAGEEWGLSSDIAAVVALETVLGTAWMAATSGESMDDVVRRVASPNGTTEAGLAVLDNDRVLDQLISVAIEAAARRGAELAEEVSASAG